VLGGPEIGCFVEDFRSVREDHEAVSKAGGNPEHFAVGGAQGFCHPPTESGRVAAEIDGDVVDLSAETANELSLGLLDLVMETTYYAPVGEGLVVLNERAPNAHFRQNPFIVASKKEPRLSSNTLGSRSSTSGILVAAEFIN